MQTIQKTVKKRKHDRKEKSETKTRRRKEWSGRIRDEYEENGRDGENREKT